MTIKGYEISYTLFGVALVSSLDSILPAFMAFFNKMILYIPELITGSDSAIFGIIISLALSLFFLNKYRYSESTEHRILNAIAASIFINSLVLFIFDAFLMKTEIYNIRFLLAALAVGGGLFAVDMRRHEGVKKDLY